MNKNQFFLSVKIIVKALIYFYLFIPFGFKLSSQTINSIVPFNQKDVVLFQEVKTREYSTALSTINSIIKTKDGFLWIATSSGLLRYDGYRYSIYDRKKNKVFNLSIYYNLFESKDGVLWVSSLGGLISIKNGVYKIYDIRDGLPDNDILCINEDKNGYLWVGSNGKGVFTFKDGKINIINELKNTIVSNIIRDNENNLWFGTFDKGVFCLRDGKFRLYTTKDGLKSNHIISLLCDKKNNIWIGTAEGLSKLTNSKITTYTKKEGLSSNSISAICEDNEGTIWIGTSGGGIDCIKNGKIIATSRNNFLKNEVINSIYNDKDGNVWFGSTSGFLGIISKDRIIPFTTEDGLPDNWLWSIFEDNEGSLWLGTNGHGISKIKNNKILTYTTKDGLPGDIVRVCCQDKDGNMWIGTSGGGLAMMKKGKIKIYNDKNGLQNNYIKSIYSDSKKNLWIGTDAGLSKLENDRFINFSNNDGIFPGMVRQITEDNKGNIWIAANRGVSKYSDGMFTNYLIDSMLPDNVMLSIYVDKENVVWLGTNGGGLARLKEEKIIKFLPENGLPDDVIYQILEDSENNLWMSCNKGIFNVRKSDLNSFADGKIKSINCNSYSKESGMLTSECNGGNQNAGCITKDGKIWFPTMQGIAMFNPKNVKKDNHPPAVLIEKFLVDNDEIDILNQTDIEFSSGKERFEFHFIALSLINPEKNKYKYLLEGIDKDWISTSSNPIAIYGNLSPGRYKFKVIACNKDEYWNEVGASIGFYLKPHFYQTFWFYTLCVILFLSLIGGSFQFRIRQMKRRERRLIKIVDEKTKDLKESESQLRNLNSSLIELNQNLKEINSTKDKLFSIIGHDLRGPIGTFMNYIQLLSENWDTISHDELKKFLVELKDISEKTYDLLENLLHWARSQRGTIDYNPELLDINIIIDENINLLKGSAIRKSINLYSDSAKTITAYFDKNMIKTVVRNLISNALKFTKEGVIKVSAIDEESSIVVLVNDNGTGISKENLQKLFRTDTNFTTKGTGGEKGTGLGLILCKEFVERNGGKIWVESELGKGTTFYFSLPKQAVA